MDCPILLAETLFGANAMSIVLLIAVYLNL